MDQPEEFSLEAMQEIINEAQETIRSVRLSLRLRDPSIELPADDSVPTEEESNRNRDTQSAQDDSEDSRENVLPLRDTENNRTDANCEVREAILVDISSPEDAQRSRDENNEFSRDSGDCPISLETFEVPEASGASGGNSFVDDEVILVSETRNTNPIVIDLCSPDVTSNLRNALCQNAPTRRRQRRRRDEISSVEIVEDGPSPEKIATPVDNNLVKCTICMEDIKNRRPHSTICGHLFCYTCIVSAIRFSRKCPICRKGLTPKNIHPIFY